MAAFDLDGTILNQGRLSELNRKALWMLHERGVEVVVSTGRHHRMIPPEVRELPFIRYGITSNGAQVLDLRNGGAELSKSPFEQELGLRLIRLMLDKGCRIHIFLRDRVLLSWRDLRRISRRMSTQKSQPRRFELFRWAKFAFSPFHYVKSMRAKIYKITAEFSDQAACTAMLIYLKQNYPIEAVSIDGRVIEMTASEVNKGTGLVKLCETLDVDARDVIVFGDSTNDIAIMEKSGFAVAMGNADDEVKAVADYVAPHVEEDGVAQAISVLFT